MAQLSEAEINEAATAIRRGMEVYVHREHGRMPAADAIQVMKDFTDRVRNHELWQALTYALKRPRPFQTFKGELAKFPKNYDKWREYRQLRYRGYVAKALAPE